jgi:hypothetical protein
MARCDDATYHKHTCPSPKRRKYRRRVSTTAVKQRAI